MVGKIPNVHYSVQDERNPKTEGNQNHNSGNPIGFDPIRKDEISGFSRMGASFAG